MAIQDEILNNLQTFANDIRSNHIDFIQPNAEVRLNTPIHKINTELNKYKQNLRISHINAVSVPKHKDEISRVIYKTDMDFIGVSETNIKKGTPSSLYQINGYKLFKVNRENKHNGGVGVYIKEQYKARKIKIDYNQDQPEMIFVEIEVRNNKILVGVIYKSPSVRYGIFSEIEEIIAYITTKYTHVILLGDYNINFLNKGSGEVNYFTSHILQPFALEQIVTQPTRITDKTKTLIDLVLVNSPQNVNTTGVAAFPGFSDHSMVYLSYSLKRPKFVPKKIIRRDFRNFSSEDFNKEVETAPWGNLYAIQQDTELTPEENVDNQVTVLENLLGDIINRHAPMREILIKKPVIASWMNDDITKLMDTRDSYKEKFDRTQDMNFYNIYKNLKNQVNHAIRKAKITEFNENLNSKIKNAKKFHEQLKRHNVVNSKKNENNTCSFKPDDLNKCFAANNNATVNNELLENEINRIMQSAIPEYFDFREVTELEVKKVVKSLKTNACGVDGISSFFIKTSIEYSVHAITEIINCSIKHKHFPVRWKKAKIKPIPKIPEPMTLKDFRPISLLVAFSKIIEKLIANQMKEYLFGNHLMDDFQSAYRIKHSTTTALLDITDKTYKALDRSEVIVLVLLDYSKAFDCANHRLMNAKLKALGFKQAALDWINSYLSGRSQQVFTESGESSWIYLINGVPQGSILGPLLFTILVNDICQALHFCHYHLYADDTQIYITCKIEDLPRIIEQINADLERIALFSLSNCLNINEGKSKYIIIGSKNNIAKLKETALPPITMNNKIIERVTEIRNLGVTFDETMSWDKHISNIVSIAYGKLRLAYRHIQFLTPDSRQAVVESYVLSQFNYCDVILQNITTQLSDKIQKVQNSCVRFIFNLKKYDHISPYLKELNILKMENRRLSHALSLVHNIVNGRAPKYLINRVMYNHNVHAHVTRFRDSIVIARTRNNYGHHRFFVKMCKTYNDVTKILKLNRNISTYAFKKKIKKYFLDKQFT